MAADRRRDYYEVLGVPRNASTEDLQRAYRALARRNHPDVNKDPAAEERFREINDAYHVLADPETRRRYDRFGADFRNVRPDTDERYTDERYAGAGAGRRGQGAGDFGGGSGGFRYTRGGGGAVDLEELFGDLFGGARRGGGGAEGLAGADQEAELPLSVEEAFRGGRRGINLAGREYDVTIPRGVTDGQRIRLAGQGGRGRGNGPPGDLYLVVRLLPHPRYRLVGRDVSVDLPIAPWEAVLGARVSVPTPGGDVTVSVPAGSSTGRRLRLRGQGMPNPRGEPGDLYAEVKIMVPASVTDTEREIYQQLSTVSADKPREGGRR